MIYTITFNPSLDYVLRVPKLFLGSINRAEDKIELMFDRISN